MGKAPLLRRTSQSAPSEMALQIDFGADLMTLIADRFYEILDAGLWWGAVDLALCEGGEQAALSQLAHAGARCATVGARAGVAGYVAALAHPVDARRWVAREVSLAVGWRKRPPAPADHILFMPLGRPDFPRLPQVFDCNQQLAYAMGLAYQERLEFEQLGPNRSLHKNPSKRL